MSKKSKELYLPKTRPYSMKALLPRTLLGRSLLILITPVLLIQVITTFMFFDRHWTKMTSRLAYSVAGEIAMIARVVEQDPDAEELGLIIQYAAQSLDFTIRFDKGAELGPEHDISSDYVWESMVAQSLLGELTGALRRPFVLNIDFQEKWVEVAVQLSNGVLTVSLPGRRLFSSSGYIFLLWMIGASLVLLVIAIIFMRNQIRPIRKLAIAAERFGKGREFPSFKPTGAREVRQAAEAFLDMHRRISRQIEQRTAMLACVSHDLRTPLTRLKLQLAMLGDSPDVDAMKGDILAMEKMIEGYLDFVRGEGDEQATYTNLNELFDKVIISAKKHGLDVTSHLTGEINITVRPMAFERCLANLMNNAGKHAEHVWISAAIVDEKLNIVVEDNGPGIPEDQYEEVFKPFYRVDSSRNASTGGVGLGLPIVMDVVHAHGGKIWLDKSAHGGLKVTIRLPF